MTTIKTLIVTMCIAGLSQIAVAQSSTPPRISASDAKNHPGETVTVCGKVVDTKVSKYGLAGRGKPVNFDLDEPEPHPVFFFVTFGSQAGTNPGEAQAAYQDKNVCVTGKITLYLGIPEIVATAPNQVQVQK